jgi:hypothetical protein
VALKHKNPEKVISNDDPMCRKVGERLTNTPFLI